MIELTTELKTAINRIVVESDLVTDALPERGVRLPFASLAQQLGDEVHCKMNPQERIYFENQITKKFSKRREELLLEVGQYAIERYQEAGKLIIEGDEIRRP